MYRYNQNNIIMSGLDYSSDQIILGCIMKLTIYIYRYNQYYTHYYMSKNV